MLKEESSQHESQDFLDEAVFWAEARNLEHWGKGNLATDIQMRAPSFSVTRFIRWRREANRQPLPEWNTFNWIGHFNVTIILLDFLQVPYSNRISPWLLEFGPLPW